MFKSIHFSSSFLRYIVFAFVAAAANMLVQSPFLFWMESEQRIFYAVGLGTIAGLITKYILDKTFVFHHSSEDLKDEMKTFGLYSFMGVFTTAIFWMTEFIFFHIFESPQAHLVGASLGLSVGYVVKYFLDKKFVFNRL